MKKLKRGKNHWTMMVEGSTFYNLTTNEVILAIKSGKFEISQIKIQTHGMMQPVNPEYIFLKDKSGSRLSFVDMASEYTSWTKFAA